VNCWEGFCRWCGAELEDLELEVCGPVCGEVLGVWLVEWACVPRPTRFRMSWLVAA
jgi:hypothetical protein